MINLCSWTCQTTSGSGCPGSAKVFMQLNGENKMSQYFQLRSNTGGKAMLQRGFTDIFLFKVPGNCKLISVWSEFTILMSKIKHCKSVRAC